MWSLLLTEGLSMPRHIAEALLSKSFCGQHLSVRSMFVQCWVSVPRKPFYYSPKLSG